MFLTEEQVDAAVDAVADCFEWDLTSQSTSAEVQAVASGVLADHGFPANVQRRKSLLRLIDRRARVAWESRMILTQLHIEAGIAEAEEEMARQEREENVDLASPCWQVMET